MEYVILGQHQIEYKGMSSYQIFDENGLGYYIDHIEYACSHGLCDCIAHPDVFLWAYPKLDGSARQACARIAEIAAEYNVPLELNSGGIRFGKMEYSDGMRYPYPVRMFFHEAAKRKCIVIPGVDAHDPSDLENEVEMKVQNENRQVKKDSLEDILEAELEVEVENKEAKNVENEIKDANE